VQFRVLPAARIAAETPEQEKRRRYERGSDERERLCLHGSGGAEEDRFQGRQGRPPEGNGPRVDAPGGPGCGTQGRNGQPSATAAAEGRRGSGVRRRRRPAHTKSGSKFRFNLGLLPDSFCYRGLCNTTSHNVAYATYNVV